MIICFKSTSGRLEINAWRNLEEIRRFVGKRIAHQRGRIARLDPEMVRNKFKPAAEREKMVVLELEAELVRAVVHIFDPNMRGKWGRDVGFAIVEQVLHGPALISTVAVRGGFAIRCRDPAQFHGMYSNAGRELHEVRRVELHDKRNIELPDEGGPVERPVCGDVHRLVRIRIDDRAADAIVNNRGIRSLRWDDAEVKRHRHIEGAEEIDTGKIGCDRTAPEAREPAWLEDRMRDIAQIEIWHVEADHKIALGADLVAHIEPEPCFAAGPEGKPYFGVPNL